MRRLYRAPGQGGMTTIAMPEQSATTTHIDIGSEGGSSTQSGGQWDDKKQYLKTRPVCKVTFSLAKEAALQAERVCVVGEFNDWSPLTPPP